MTQMTRAKINQCAQAFVSEGRCVHVEVSYRSLVINSVNRQDRQIQSEQKIRIEQGVKCERGLSDSLTDMPAYTLTYFITDLPAHAGIFLVADLYLHFTCQLDSK